MQPRAGKGAGEGAEFEEVLQRPPVIPPAARPTMNGGIRSSARLAGGSSRLPVAAPGPAPAPPAGSRAGSSLPSIGGHEDVRHAGSIRGGVPGCWRMGAQARVADLFPGSFASAPSPHPVSAWKSCGQVVGDGDNSATPERLTSPDERGLGIGDREFLSAHAGQLPNPACNYICRTIRFREPGRTETGMAQKAQTLLIDDLDGSDAEGAVFSDWTASNMRLT